MLRNIIFIVLLSFPSLHQLSGQGSNDIQSFSLVECINYALDHNTQVQNAILEKRSADGRVGESLSEGLPQINLDAGLNYNYQVQTSLLEANGLDPNAPADSEIEAQFGQPYDANAVVTLEQLIFKGSYFVGLKAARTFRELTEKEHKNSEVDITELVSKAYYQALISKEIEILTDQNYYRLDSLYRETKILYENGLAESLDLLRAKIQFNDIRIDQKIARQEYDINLKLLKFQMGMPVNSPIELSDNLDDVDPYLSEDYFNNFKYNDRIDYSLLESNLSLAELDVKNEQVQYYPEVRAFVNYGTNTATSTSSEIFDFNDRWFGFGTVGATIKVPIFDGRFKRNRIIQKQVEIDKIKNEFEQLENNIDLEIYQKKAEYETRLENISTQKENIELAELIYRSAKLKYDEGIGSSLEVTDANTSFKTTQTEYYQALYEALITKVELEKALGITLGK